MELVDLLSGISFIAHGNASGWRDRGVHRRSAFAFPELFATDKLPISLPFVGLGFSFRVASPGAYPPVTSIIAHLGGPQPPAP